MNNTYQYTFAHETDPEEILNSLKPELLRELLMLI